ncbi:PREDICTED: neuronal-specific septin-3-like [Cyprinodon variegatus]|nr:PREDICTED: neuronal-specific septin-3-like [Cyprinodon variegatus]
MKRLGKIVSIVPVIAKADTLTVEERQEFKERIRQDLASNGIRVYPQREYDEDPEERLLNDRIRENIPFAVVGTDKEHQVNGNKVLGRKTKWGIIEGGILASSLPFPFSSCCMKPVLGLCRVRLQALNLEFNC